MSETATGKKRYVGQSVRRVGDRRLVTGHGRFVDDVHIAGALDAVMVRSPYAHARIVSIDASEALKAPGVVAVLTGEEIAKITQPQGSPEQAPDRRLERYPLAIGKAMYVGDAVAVVLGTNFYSATDAAELVNVEYEPLDPVVDAEAALAEDAPLLYPDWGDNLAFRWQAEGGDVDRAFTEASHTVSIRLRNQRIHATFIEPRAITIDYDPSTEEMTAWATTQTPHRLRGGIAATLGMPEHHVRVIAPDVGGAFGAKGPVYPEYLVAAALAYKFRKPVKWTETRRETFVGTNHGRDQVQKLTAAIDDDGKILGLKVELISNVGAYGAATVATRSGVMASGAYRIENLRSTVLGVMTNTTPTGAYRGAGRPEAAYMVERMMDAIARELSLDPVEVRRRNFISPDAFPYMSATGIEYDSGNYDLALTEALERIDYDRIRSEQAAARAEGRLVGLGMAVYCELAGPGWDSGSALVQPSGTVMVTTGISPHGQGEETTFAQIVADELGIPMEDVVVKASDTAITPQGIGTFGSRGTSIGGSAVLLAVRQVKHKAAKIAAARLEVSEDDIVFEDGRLNVRGTPDRGMTFKQVAQAAYGMGGLPSGLEPGLDATSYFSPTGRTFPFGAHIALVEIDRESGELHVLRYLAVDDCGPLINPQLVEGQVIGGLAQGFGQALGEAIVYDDNGQLLTGSMMDYFVPKADLMPTIETAHTVTPSPVNPLGVKGVGEAGTTGSPPALVNAVLDALSPLGIEHVDMPMTSQRLWKLIQDAEVR
ncbi:MAG: xanthine dehydrogenase family protein molybdopterin-binding subunit [Nitrolancea sp.]